jgi:integrase
MMTVTLLPAAMEILNRRYVERKSDEWVFPSKFADTKTGHITEPKAAWKQICKAAKISGVRIHDLRRTMGSWQAMTGASLSVIGKSLGHSSQSVTQIYARLNDDPVRLSMQKALTAMLGTGDGEEKKETQEGGTDAK